jgi:murein DD-endopeptidase MepM/ murein hydrolase activator NlpD
MNPKRFNNLRMPGVVTTPFGGKTRGEPIHPGVDIANKSGTPSTGSGSNSGNSGGSNTWIIIVVILVIIAAIGSAIFYLAGKNDSK